MNGTKLTHSLKESATRYSIARALIHIKIFFLYIRDKVPFCRNKYLIALSTIAFLSLILSDIIDAGRMLSIISSLQLIMFSYVLV